MTIITIYKSPTITKNQTRRYVRRLRTVDDKFSWCIVDVTTHYTIEEGMCDRSDLPEHISRQADKLMDIWPSYVDWPI